MPKLVYAIGDVQGCFEPLQRLLKKINYHPDHHQLWFTGDLVNRGPESLKTLRFVKQLPEDTVCVLGNHDLGLLSIAIHANALHPEDTFTDILNAPDKEELLDWLRHRPILHHDTQLGFTLTHAGILPSWTLLEAQAFAKELEAVLRGPHYEEFLRNMYGNAPTTWEDAMMGWDRFRFITNAFTRMRFCTPTGMLDFSSKGAEHPEASHIPWFKVPNRRMTGEKIVFGHWAALQGKSDEPGIFPIDTGCVWGNCLTALCLHTQERVSVDCKG